MNNVEEIVKSSKSDKPFDKEAWIQRKQEERNEAYSLIDKTAEEVVQDSEKFKQYIDIQGRFDKYSVGNALLITAQMPTATRLKDFEGWKEAGGYVNKGANGITILEPGDSYTNKDGNISQSYNPKKIFDISQTNVRPNNKENKYDEKLMLKSLLHECPVDVKVVDELDSGKMAEWNKTDNVLYVGREENTTAIFNAISKEIARSSFDSSTDSQTIDFKADYISYMVAKKYGIDVSDIKLSQVPNSLQNLEPKDIRNELSSMRSVMEDMNSRMSQYFESIAKTNKSKDQER